jgi:GT2 family glycosyltransferase
MDISIIIVNYNTLDLTKKSIDSIFEFRPENLKIEVFVVDNASTDGSKEHFEKDNRIIYLYSEENLGFGRANNIAIAKSRAKYIFLLNSDAYLIEDVLTPFYDFMENPENQMVACCGANMIDDKGKNTTIGGHLPTVKESCASLGFAVFFLSYYRKYLAGGMKHYPEKGTIYEIDYVLGADMFLRKSVVDKVGGFDPDFFMYYEESEMTFRFKKYGYKSYILANTKLVHLEGSSSNTPELKIKKEKFFSECRYLYFEKCHGKTSARLVTVLFCLQSLFFGILKLRKSDFIRAKIIISTIR